MAADIAMADDHMQLVFTTAIALPLQMFGGPPGSAMPLASGFVRVPMRKENAIEFANKILEQAEDLSDTPAPNQKPADLIVANSMNDVQNVAKQAEQFKGK